MAYQPAMAKAKKPAKKRLTFASDVPNSVNTIENIQTEEADPPLREFPAILRQQIEQYLARKTDSKPVSFVSGSTAFRLHTIYTGEPAYFVVSGTKEPLDAGLYRYGIRKGGRSIIVVQPKDGRTTFNNGQPAIIAYYSKGRKDETASRFAVWSPEGVYRNDVFVDRMRGQQIVISQPLQHVTQSFKSSVKVEETSPMQYAQSITPTDEFDPTLRPQPIQHDVDHYAQAEEDDDDDDGYSLPATLSSPPYQDNMRYPHDEVEKANKRTLPPHFEERQEPHKKMHNETHNSDESIVDPDLTTSPVNSSQPTFSMDKIVIFTFKEDVHAENGRLSKTLEQCDHVQKFFAYARMARISDHKHVMLEAHIDEGNTVLVVRDDDSTFDDLLDAIKQKQNEEGQHIHITIAPADY